MKKVSLIMLIILVPFTLWAGGKKDSESSDSTGIEDPKKNDNKDSLLALAESGDADGIESLLKVDIDLNETDGSGRTALHVAAESGDADIAAILLIRGAKIDPKEDTGKTPLLLAVQLGNTEVMEVLAAAGADLSITDDSGNSPATQILLNPADQIRFLMTDENIDIPAVDGKPLLHASASRGFLDHLLALLDEGADTAVLDGAGDSALDAAVSSSVNISHARCASALLKAGSPAPRREEWAYIVEPLRSGDLEIRFDYGSTALHLAAEKGHEGMVRYLLENSADIDARDQPGNTALHVAVRRGYRTIATLLLDKGSEVNVKDYNGNAPIHESLTANDGYAITSMLIDRGADPNIKNSSGSTPLHMTVMLMGGVEGARLLLDRGALIDPRDRSGNTPLLLAVEAADRDLSELFLSRSADIFARNNKGITPAQGALSYGSEVCTWFFTGYRLTETDNEGRSVLHMAVSIEVDTETLEVLLKGGAIPNLRDFNGETALHYAVEDGSIPLAVMLLDYSSDPFLENNDGLTPLIRAFDHGPELTVGLLTGRIDKEDRWGNTALFHAVDWKYPVIAEALLMAGADPRHKNRQGSTALHEAVHTDSPETASLLLNAGADPNAGNDLGRTPIHEAVTWDTFEILRLLADRGARIDARDDTGQSALHMAAFAGNNEIAEWLLISGASPDVRDKNGQTPLFICAESDRIDTAALLLDNGAGLQLRDNNGRTVLHIAVRGARTSTSKFLINAGSDIFAVDRSGETPFDLALESGSALISALMDKNLVNRQDNMGNTPLHLAVKSSADETTLQILLEKGADRQARNAAGQTASDLASEMGNTALATLLM